jgi:hypothetical protein
MEYREGSQSEEVANETANIVRMLLRVAPEKMLTIRVRPAENGTIRIRASKTVHDTRSAGRTTIRVHSYETVEYVVD